MRLLVTGGGTGGHLFPGIAIAEAMRDRLPGSEILFVGTGRQVDRAGLANRGLQLATIRCEPLKGTAGSAALRTMLQLPRALADAVRVIRRFRPDLVIGVGGYVSGPVTLAACLLGIAACIHEQNSVPGITNRLLGRLVDRVFISLPGSESYFPGKKTILTGNPVRAELLRGPRPPRDSRQTLLVLGGSQGAHRLNVLMQEAVRELLRALPALRIIHQTGAADEESVRAAYQTLGVEAEVQAFFTDMATIYAQADLVLARAGATTLAELTLLGKPALLVPYPFAADAHQEKNAKYVAGAGAARMLLEPALTAQQLAGELIGLLSDRTQLAAIGANAAKLGRPQATATIVEECMQLVRNV